MGVHWLSLLPQCHVGLSPLQCPRRCPTQLQSMMNLHCLCLANEGREGGEQLSLLWWSQVRWSWRTRFWWSQVRWSWRTWLWWSQVRWSWRTRLWESVVPDDPTLVVSEVTTEPPNFTAAVIVKKAIFAFGLWTVLRAWEHSESTPEPAPVQEPSAFTPELVPVQESTPEPAPVPPEVAASAAEPPEAAVSASGRWRPLLNSQSALLRLRRPLLSGLPVLLRPSGLLLTSLCSPTWAAREVFCLVSSAEVVFSSALAAYQVSGSTLAVRRGSCYVGASLLRPADPALAPLSASVSGSSSTTRAWPTIPSASFPPPSWTFVFSGGASGIRSLKGRQCHNVWLVCPCRPLEGTFPYCVCFSGLQFPSPFALTIKSNFIQLCLIYLLTYPHISPVHCVFGCWFIILLCVFWCSVLPWFVFFFFGGGIFLQ